MISAIIFYITCFKSTETVLIMDKIRRAHFLYKYDLWYNLITPNVAVHAVVTSGEWHRVVIKQEASRPESSAV